MKDLGNGDIDTDVAITVLEQAGRLCSETLAPLNRVGDEEGSRLEDGAVTTAPGFREAYKQFVDGG